MIKTDVVVIGSGAIGLAAAYKIASNGSSVIIFEKEAQFGRGVSSRSSEVIHAGIYYHTGSLKASLCLRGRELLYRHCEKYNVKHKRTGKLFVAVDPEDTARLEATRRQAEANGVDDVRMLDALDVKKAEPQLKAVAALFSPSSGIFDSHGFMKSLLDLGKAAGMVFAASSTVAGASRGRSGWRIYIEGDEPVSVSCRAVVNAAGLEAINLSKKVFPDRVTPEQVPTKGNYARLSGKAPLKHIIYPAIVPGLIEERVDATPDLAGSLRFGPNIEKTDGRDDFAVNPDIVSTMIRGIKRYLPEIDEKKLQPDCAGIRPKISTGNGGLEDFMFDWAPEPGWLDLWGIESPGLTASLAIGEHVYGLMHKMDIL